MYKRCSPLLRAITDIFFRLDKVCITEGDQLEVASVAS